jgi:hypothetical protein
MVELTYLNWRDEFVYCFRKDFRYIKGLSTRGGKVPVKVGRILCGCEWCKMDLKRYDLNKMITPITIDINLVGGYLNG